MTSAIWPVTFHRHAQQSQLFFKSTFCQRSPNISERRIPYRPSNMTGISHSVPATRLTRAWPRPQFRVLSPYLTFPEMPCQSWRGKVGSGPQVYLCIAFYPFVQIFLDGLFALGLDSGGKGGSLQLGFHFCLVLSRINSFRLFGVDLYQSKRGGGERQRGRTLGQVGLNLTG